MSASSKAFCYFPTIQWLCGFIRVDVNYVSKSYILVRIFNWSFVVIDDTTHACLANKLSAVHQVTSLRPVTAKTTQGRKGNWDLWKLYPFNVTLQRGSALKDRPKPKLNTIVLHRKITFLDPKKGLLLHYYLFFLL